jgi:RNA polymerase sigma factor (sigma-70 family)
MLILSFGCLRFLRESCLLYAFLLGYLPSIFFGLFLQNLLTFICRTAYVVLAVKRKRQAYIKKKIRDKENQAKREEEQSNFGAEENTVWDRLEVQNEELVAAVQQLKPKARFIVTGYVLKGKTFKELAQETKLTERAAASTYYRSIEKLRIKMEKEK